MSFGAKNKKSSDELFILEKKNVKKETLEIKHQLQEDKLSFIYWKYIFYNENVFMCIKKIRKSRITFLYDPKLFLKLKLQKLDKG